MVDMSNSVWHQIVVTDPQGLSGASVASFIEPIVRKLGATVVVASDLVGACPGLLGCEKRPLESGDFLRRVGNATQYDWAFFFLYSTPPKSEDLTSSDDKRRIWNADATIRLADDQYFYVYSRDEEVASEVQRKYPAVEHKTSTFEELDIPY